MTTQADVQAHCILDSHLGPRAESAGMLALPSLKLGEAVDVIAIAARPSIVTLSQQTLH